MSSRSAERSPSPPLVILDARPLLAAGEHPVTRVEAAVAALPEDGVLEVIVPFEPRPLLERLRAAGAQVRCTGVEGTFFVHVGKRPLPALLDLTDLAPPEPLERVLEAASALAEGATLLARLPRTPVLLWPQLEARGLTFASALRPDDTALVWVRR